MHHHHWHWLGVFFRHYSWVAPPLDLFVLVLASYAILGLWRNRPNGELTLLLSLALLAEMFAIPFSVYRYDGLSAPGTLGLPEEASPFNAISWASVLILFAGEYPWYFRKQSWEKTPGRSKAIFAALAAANFGGMILFYVGAEIVVKVVGYIPIVTYALIAIFTVALVTGWMQLLLSRVDRKWRNDLALRRHFDLYSVIAAATIFGYLLTIQLSAYLFLMWHWDNATIETSHPVFWVLFSMSASVIAAHKGRDILTPGTSVSNLETMGR